MKDYPSEAFNLSRFQSKVNNEITFSISQCGQEIDFRRIKGRVIPVALDGFPHSAVERDFINGAVRK
jgi:hypothetical protein